MIDAYELLLQAGLHAEDKGDRLLANRYRAAAAGIAALEADKARLDALEDGLVAAVRTTDVAETHAGLTVVNGFSVTIGDYQAEAPTLRAAIDDALEGQRDNEREAA